MVRTQCCTHSIAHTCDLLSSQCVAIECGVDRNLLAVVSLSTCLYLHAIHSSLISCSKYIMAEHVQKECFFLLSYYVSWLC